MIFQSLTLGIRCFIRNIFVFDILTVDCVIEVHDARIPLSGRNLDFRNDITGNRPHILVLNKKDLIFGTRNSKESNYKEEKLKERIKEVDESISEVIFTNCTKTRCPGLQSVRKILIIYHSKI